MNFFDLTFWQNFVSNGLATLIGAGLGVLTALWLNNHVEGRTEQQKKEKILFLLLEEIAANSRYLKKFFPEDGSEADDAQTADIFISTRDESWNAFSDGGELQWIKDVDTLNRLALSYHRLRAIKILSQRFHEMVTLRGPGVRPADIANVKNKLRQKIQEYLIDSVEIAETIKPHLE